MAFVSIDNAVEQTLRTYLSLPDRYFKGRAPPPRADSDADFREIVLSVFAHAKMPSGLRKAELLKYHEQRNIIYHRSILSDVDPRFLDEYYRIAHEILTNLLTVRADSFSAVLARFREDIVAELEQEWRAEQAATHSKRVKGGLSKLSEQGRHLGRERKELTQQQFDLAVRLRQELHWGAESIAAELSRQRGADRLTDPGARVAAAVSPTLVRVRLREAGKWNIAGRTHNGRKLLPEGFV